MMEAEVVRNTVGHNKELRLLIMIIIFCVLYFILFVVALENFERDDAARQLHPHPWR